ncbi:MAG: UDP-N-acetylmuramate dehydrogenase [Pseudomonadota bacterium]
MSAATQTPRQEGGLIDRLPPVRGDLRPDVSLAPMAWMRVGGPAEILFKPADTDDLRAFLANCPADIPVTTIGVASNLLVRDGGIPGVVIKLGRGFNQIEIDGTTVHAGSAALDAVVARTAAKAGLGGLEFFVGIPGTIGGALRMNGGAYGAETRDVLLHANAIDRQGKQHRVTADDMGMAYRHSDAPADWVFVSADFNASPGDADAITERMNQISSARSETQPIKERTGGSTFANPPGHKAWQVIEQAGCRGLMVGAAQMSELHCNFMINTGGATAADMESLGEEVRRRVREKLGVELRWEIKRVGIPAEGGAHG